MPPGFRFAPFWQTARRAVGAAFAGARGATIATAARCACSARLRDDVTVAQAQQELTAIAARLERDHPRTNTGIGITVEPLLDKVVCRHPRHAARADGDGHASCC